MDLVIYSKCEYRNDFFTSSKVGWSFEVNKRIVYSMHSLGIGYTGMYGKVQRFDEYATSNDQK